MFKPAFSMRILLILFFSICQSFKQRNNCRKEKESDLACAINVSWLMVYIINTRKNKILITTTFVEYSFYLSKAVEM